VVRSAVQSEEFIESLPKLSAGFFGNRGQVYDDLPLIAANLDHTASMVLLNVGKACWSKQVVEPIPRSRQVIRAAGVYRGPPTSAAISSPMRMISPGQRDEKSPSHKAGA
jgi:hypothetical protein